jgi:DNA-binding transcriptional MerR regulator
MNPGIADEAEEPGRRIAKSAAAFRTISEVADELDVPQHVLRFWETKFTQIRPLKRGGGRRYYRPEDVVLLRRVSQLLYHEGYTIKGVQRLLREGGLRPVKPDTAEATLPLDLEEPEVPEPEDFEPPAEPPPPAPRRRKPALDEATRQALQALLDRLVELRSALVTETTRPSLSVIPAKAGIHVALPEGTTRTTQQRHDVDPRLRGDDDGETAD